MEYAVTARERQGLLEFAKTRSVDVEDLCSRLFAEKKPPESIKYFRSASNRKLSLIQVLYMIVIMYFCVFLVDHGFGNLNAFCTMTTVRDGTNAMCMRKSSMVPSHLIRDSEQEGSMILRATKWPIIAYY